MGAGLTADPDGIEAFAAANETAGMTLSTAGAADSAAMFTATALAIGPIGAAYLAAYAPAQNANLAGTLMVGAVHTGICEASRAASAALTDTDSAFAP